MARLTANQCKPDLVSAAESLEEYRSQLKDLDACIQEAFEDQQKEEREFRESQAKTQERVLSLQHQRRVIKAHIENSEELIFRSMHLKSCVDESVKTYRG